MFWKDGERSISASHAGSDKVEQSTATSTKIGAIVNLAEIDKRGLYETYSL